MASSRLPLMAGNWKMNFDHLRSIAFVQKLAWTLKDAKHSAAAVEVAAYRIATEAVTNSARHSGTDRASVRIERHGGVVLRFALGAQVGDDFLDLFIGDEGAVDAGDAAAEALHGDISQAQRIKVIDRFKRKKFNILIATDVAARGIDINNLTHVINFSIPQEAESYIHRIGRTGRAGKTGTAITFVTPSEYRKLTFIQKLTNTEIRRERLPTPKDIIANKKVKFTGINHIGSCLTQTVITLKTRRNVWYWLR